MQTMIVLLDALCTQKRGYEAYQEKVQLEVNNNPKFLDEWDEWCFLAYFSQKPDLNSVSQEFLLAVGDIILHSSVYCVFQHEA